MAVTLPCIQDIEAEVAAGFITKRKHPTADLFIYNYADRCQYENHWTPATLACRGLILDGAGNVVARPFPKFFNYEQVIDQIPAEPFEVFDKLDGSLGIIYRGPDGLAVATRGSFTSDQAIVATKMLHEEYPFVIVPDGVTPLVEIIYPENRIVVDYGDRRDLVLLTAIENATGREPYNLKSIGLPVVERFDGMTDFGMVLEHNRDNAEGFVIRFQSGFRCKIKLAEYVRLHKLLTGITPRYVWEHLKDGREVAEVADRVPDEFYAWLRETAATIRNDFDVIEATCRSLLDGKSFAARKDAAAYITATQYPSILFAMLDNKPHADAIWKLVRPEASRAFRCGEAVLA